MMTKKKMKYTNSFKDNNHNSNRNTKHFRLKHAGVQAKLLKSQEEPLQQAVDSIVNLTLLHNQVNSINNNCSIWEQLRLCNQQLIKRIGRDQC